MTNSSSIRPIQTTGRYLVLLPEEDARSGMSALTDSTGVRDIDDSALSNIGVVVVTLGPDQVQSLNTKISISVDDAHLPQIQQVSQQLQSSGMNLEVER